MYMLSMFSKKIQVNDVDFYVRKPLSTLLVPDIYVVRVSGIFEEDKKFPLSYCPVQEQWYYGCDWWRESKKEFLGDDMVKICVQFYHDYILSKNKEAVNKSKFDKAWEAVPDKVVVKI